MFVLFICLHFFQCLCFVLLAHYLLVEFVIACLCSLTLLTSAFQHYLTLLFMHCFLMFFNIAYYYFSCLICCCSSHCLSVLLAIAYGVVHCWHHQNFILCTYTTLTLVGVVVSYCFKCLTFVMVLDTFPTSYSM